MTDTAGLLSVFERIYVINLRHRTDRRDEMAAELGRLGLGFDDERVILFEASAPADPGAFPSKGARGCFESHLAVHEAILADGVRSTLILEDDAGFVADFAERFRSLRPILAAQSCDLLYSVVEADVARPEDRIADDLVRIDAETYVMTTHFMGVSKRFSVAAAPFLRALAARPGGDPAGGPMHVDGAYNWMRRAHPELRVLATRTPLARQRPSQSDIAPPKIWDQVPGLRALLTRVRRLTR